MAQNGNLSGQNPLGDIIAYVQGGQQQGQQTPQPPGGGQQQGSGPAPQPAPASQAPSNGILAGGIYQVNQKTNRATWMGGGALGVAALALGLAGFNYMTNNNQWTGINNNAEDIAYNAARIDIPADTMMIRNYALESGSCESAPSWTPYGQDCKFNVDDGATGTDRYEGFVDALEELDFASGYDLEDAHFRLDHLRNPIPINSNTRPLESMLTLMHGDSANDNGLIYWLSNPNAPAPSQRTRVTYTPTATSGATQHACVGHEDRIRLTGDGPRWLFNDIVFSDCGGGRYSIPRNWCSGSNETRVMPEFASKVGNGRNDITTWSCDRVYATSNGGDGGGTTGPNPPGPGPGGRGTPGDGRGQDGVE